MYAECILFWLMENAEEGLMVETFEMQDGCGLPDFEFRIGMGWLIEHQLLDQMDESIH